MKTVISFLKNQPFGVSEIDLLLLTLGQNFMLHTSSDWWQKSIYICEAMNKL